MLCEVRLQELLPQSEILIPLGLVHADGDGIQYVFLAEKGVAKRRRVLLGKLVENQVVVEKGLSPGDLLILNPAIDLLDGMPVTF
ncbi:hypothetical protein V8V91_19320 [Algoriphagus halophilus]|uniref:hypothetical protein n=1 Tax=Algoriphagus halophilus TaxID=226505 RepID=UPI00358FEB00